jgi:hypothetical protein
MKKASKALDLKKESEAKDLLDALIIAKSEFD